MKRKDLLALPVTVDVLTAAKALGIGRTLAHDLIRRDQFPCRVLRIGTRYRVPTSGPRGLLAACGVEPQETGAAEPAA